jgi:pectate lyase
VRGIGAPPSTQTAPPLSRFVASEALLFMRSRTCVLATRLTTALIAAQAARAFAATPAFPEAEGFGAMATGGRGNKVVHVTNLADSGAGSLRDAISQGNRIVVFDVGGVITLASKLAAGGDNLTIAGQTAPGDGITVYGNGTSFSSRKNIVVRFVRFHQGLAKDSAEGTKAVNLTDVENMIFDHVSVEWGRWDCFGITGDSSDVTVQDSIIGEAIVPQKFGALMDSADRITIARTLWINNESRNPKFKANGQYVNNVVYNWGSGGGLIGGHSSADWYEDVINNYFIAGPANTGSFLSQYAGTDRVYQQGNLVDLDRNGKLNGRAVANGDFKGDSPPTFETAAHNKPSVPVAVLSPEAAYDRIVAQAGVCAKRDAVDQRLITQLRSLGTSGAIVGGDDGEAAVGGQPATTQSQRPAGFDSDGDGMPDAWETAHGLDPSGPADATADSAGDGYSNVEKYLNELATTACGGSVPAQPDAGADGARDGAASADGARADAVDASKRDAANDPADAGAPALDTADGWSRDGIASPDASPSLPDSATASRDASDPSPEVPPASSDSATVSTDTRPLPDAVVVPDAFVPGPDLTAASDAAPDSATGSPNAGTAASTPAAGCTCSLGSGHGSAALPWLLLVPAWLARRRRR